MKRIKRDFLCRFNAATVIQMTKEYIFVKLSLGFTYFFFSLESTNSFNSQKEKKMTIKTSGENFDGWENGS